MMCNIHVDDMFNLVVAEGRGKAQWGTPEHSRMDGSARRMLRTAHSPAHWIHMISRYSHTKDHRYFQSQRRGAPRRQTQRAPCCQRLATNLSSEMHNMNLQNQQKLHTMQLRRWQSHVRKRRSRASHAAVRWRQAATNGNGTDNSSNRG